MAKKQTKKQKKAFRRLVFFLILLVILFIILCFITPKEAEVGMNASGEIPDLELPSPVPGEQIVKHKYYTLSYNEKYEVPSWVAYELLREELLGGEERQDDFRTDPAVSTGSATLEDYRKSGYDRGHLAPAADFKWSSEAMSETFFLSNMTPQNSSFNRGIWSDLEAAVRANAYDNGKLYVVTGPVLTDGPYKTIGKNKVAVPKQFYKVLLDYSDPELKAIGFILPNENSNKSLQSFAVSVDEVEQVTGLDFFPSLPDDQEEILESTYDPALWSFRNFVAPKDPSALAQIPEQKDEKKEELTKLLMISIYQVKKAIFDYTGTTKLARSYGLL